MRGYRTPVQTHWDMPAILARDTVVSMTANSVLGLLAMSLAGFACAGHAVAQSAYPMGGHRLALLTPGGDLPFGLALEGDGKGNLEAFLINGSERIKIPDVRDDNGLVLGFPHYDSELRLAVDLGKSTMHGEWIKRRGKGKETRMRVASREPGPRFTMQKVSTAGDAWPNGSYRVTFAKSKDPAVGVFAPGEDSWTNCTGTFLTTLGDYRYLAGNSNGRAFKLSCFDGAHAFLFQGERQEDDSIKGDFWSSDSWHETWTGVADAKAELPDGWNLTKWRKDAQLGRGKYRDLAGEPHALTDPQFAGKVRIIEVFGSWCPNCHDHGEYMAELSRRYQDQNFQVIGLAFEHDEDFARSVRQVKAFTKRHDATFPILIAGLSNKSQATDSLGLVDKIRSFPTTIFVDKNDKVRGIYQGWSGPATGDAHKRLRQRFETLIDAMLREI